MKTKFLTLLSIIFLSANSYSQAPGSVKYQAVLRDASNVILANTTVDMQFTIYNSVAASVWTDTYTVTSNAYGLVNIDLGPGLDAINWGSDAFTMETAVDFQSGNGMEIMGSAPLLSVPYAMHASTADNVLNDNVNDADSDPNNELNTGLTLNGTSLEITDAGGTFSQDLDGTFATDAEVAAATAAITESDPIFSASPAVGIAASDITNWDAAYSWGDHSTAGYLTTELDGDPNNEIQSLNLAGLDLSISGGNTVSLPTPGDDDWTVSGADMYSGVTGNVGIGTTTPDNKLDINGKLSITESTGDEMVIINSDIWEHGSGPQDFGTGGAHFIMASVEGDYESAGFYGDGNVLTLWSPGDANNGQPSALIYVCDEDRFDGAVDNNPHNNTSIYAYLNTAGNWVAASDKNRKEEIQPLDNSLEKLLAINGYSYKFKLVQEEIDKGDVAPTTYGVIAQEVKEVLPELVDVSEDGSHFVSYIEFIPLLIESMKEQQKMIEDQNQENENLKRKLLELEERLNALERK